MERKHHNNENEKYGKQDLPEYPLLFHDTVPFAGEAKQRKIMMTARKTESLNRMHVFLD